MSTAAFFRAVEASLKAKALKAKQAQADESKVVRKLIVMRGIVGSGKTVLGQQLLDDAFKSSEMCGKYADNKEDRKREQDDRRKFGRIISADDFFMDRKTNTFKYNSAQLARAKGDCEIRVIKALKDKVVEVIVLDNAHCQLWEMNAAVSAAVANGWQVSFHEPQNEWSYDVDGCVTKSIENGKSVPRVIIEKQLNNLNSSGEATVKSVIAAKKPF